MTAAASASTITRSLAARSMLLLRRVPATLIPSLVFPIFIVVAFSGAYGGLVRLPGFPVKHMVDWMLPMAVVQGSSFAGVNVGLGMIRDLEDGFFDRLLLAPSSRLPIILGPLVGALFRAFIPTVVVLVAGLVAGAHLVGGPLGILTLLIAAEGAAVAAGAWAIGLALRFRSQRAAPLMQVGIFVAVFLSTAQVPLSVMQGWLRTVARINPMTNVLRMARAGFVGPVHWSDTWGGLVALAAAMVLLTAFAARQLRNLETL